MRRLAVLALLLAAPLSLAHADDKPWEKPKDGVLTEKQVDAYIDYTQKTLKRAKEDLLFIDQHKGETTAMLARTKESRDLEDKWLAASGLCSAELEWVKTEVQEIHTVLWLWNEKFKPDWDAQLKDANDKVAAAQKNKDAVAEAKKSGRRAMTDEEKADAKKAADEQVKAAEDALKDAKQATADAQKQLDEAKAAAKSADADSKADAEQAVKDKEEALKSAKEAEAEPAKNLEAARARAKDPTAPQTADEKADVERDNAEREKAAAEELAAAKSRRDEMQKVYSEFEQKSVKDVLAKHPAKNVEIVKARGKRIQELTDLALGALGGTPDKKEEKK